MSIEVQPDHGSYITLGDASKQSGYTTDYLSRLLKSEKISGLRIDGGWQINKASLDVFLAEVAERKRLRAEQLSLARRREYEKAVTAPQAVKEGWQAVEVKSVPSASFSEATITFEREVPLALAHPIRNGLRFGVPVLALSCILAVVLVPRTLPQHIDQPQVAALNVTAAVVDMVALQWYRFVNRSFAFLMPSSESTVITENTHTIPAGKPNQIRANWDIPESVPPKYDGAVVVPRDPTITAKEQAEMIANSFSDEVVITTVGDGTGIITPTFRSGTSGEYLYVMVPVATSSP